MIEILLCNCYFFLSYKRINAYVFKTFKRFIKKIKLEKKSIHKKEKFKRVNEK